jgi:hypothetical protein
VVVSLYQLSQVHRVKILNMGTMDITEIMDIMVMARGMAMAKGQIVST